MNMLFEMHREDGIDNNIFWSLETNFETISAGCYEVICRIVNYRQTMSYIEPKSFEILCINIETICIVLLSKNSG